MKKTFTLTLLLFSFLFGLSAQEVTNEQYSLLTKKTAEWCVNCGTWGWTYYFDAVEENKESNLLDFAYHYSGELQNQVSQDLSDNFSFPGQPVFAINNDNLSVLSFNNADKLIELKETVDILNAFPAVAGVASNAQHDFSTLQVETNFESFDDITGEYYVAQYLVQDSFLYTQTGLTGEVYHKNLLLESSTEESFGRLVSPDAMLTNGFTTNFSGEFDITGLATENLHVLTIIWNKRATGEYVFINGHRSELQITSSTIAQEDIKEDIKVAHNATTQRVDVTYKGDEAFLINQLAIVDVTGKVIMNNNTKIDMLQQRNYSVDLPQLISGTYIVQLQTSNQTVVGFPFVVQ